MTVRVSEAADKLIEKALLLFRQLDAAEFEGPLQNTADGSAFRSWPLPPFRVYYRREADELLVIRV